MTDIQILVCASLGTRAQHHICQQDTFRIHHVPPTVTSSLTKVLEFSVHTRKESPEMQGRILHRFLNEVTKVANFNIICFWHMMSSLGSEFVLISKTNAVCSSKEHFHEILQALMYLPKEGYCEFPLNFEPEVLEFSLWSRMENPNLPLICDFLEKVSFVDAGISFGCHLDATLQEWHPFGQIWCQARFHTQMDIVGFVAEMILGYVGYSISWDRNGFQYANNIVIPNYAMLGQTFKHSYLNVAEYRPSSYDQWVDRKKLWSYDRMMIEYARMKKSTGRVSKNDAISLLHESMRYVGFSGTSGINVRVRRNFFTGNGSDSGMDCPMPIECLAPYVQKILFLEGKSSDYKAFWLAMACGLLQRPEYFYGTFDKNDLSLHLGSCFNNEAWMNGELLFPLCEKFQGLLQTDSHRWVGNVTNEKEVQFAKSLWSLEEVTTLTFISYGGSHFVTVQIRKEHEPFTSGSIKNRIPPFKVLCFDSMPSGRGKRTGNLLSFNSSPPVKAVTQITGYAGKEVQKTWIEVTFFQQPDTHQCGFISFFVSLFAILNPGHTWTRLSNEPILNEHGIRILRHAFAAMYVGIDGLTVNDFRLEESDRSELPQNVTDGSELSFLLPEGGCHAKQNDLDAPGIFQTTLSGEHFEPSLTTDIHSESNSNDICSKLSAFEWQMSTYVYNDLDNAHDKVMRGKQTKSPRLDFALEDMDYALSRSSFNSRTPKFKMMDMLQCENDRALFKVIERAEACADEPNRALSIIDSPLQQLDDSIVFRGSFSHVKETCKAPMKSKSSRSKIKGKMTYFSSDDDEENRGDVRSVKMSSSDVNVTALSLKQVKKDVGSSSCTQSMSSSGKINELPKSIGKLSILSSPLPSSDSEIEPNAKMLKPLVQPVSRKKSQSDDKDNITAPEKCISRSESCTDSKVVLDNTDSDDDFQPIDLLWKRPSKRGRKPLSKDTPASEEMSAADTLAANAKIDVIFGELVRLHLLVYEDKYEQEIFSFDEVHETLITHELLNRYNICRLYKHTNGSAVYTCSKKKSTAKADMPACPYKAKFVSKKLTNGGSTLMIDKLVDHNHPPNLELPFSRKKELEGSCTSVPDVLVYPSLLLSSQREYLLKFYTTLSTSVVKYTMQQSVSKYFDWALNDVSAKKQFAQWNPKIWISDPHRFVNPFLNGEAGERHVILSTDFIKNLTREATAAVSDNSLKEIYKQLLASVAQGDLSVTSKVSDYQSTTVYESLCFMTEDMKELARQCGHWCAIDSVVGVCNPNMSIIAIVVQDEHGHMHIVFVAFLSNEKKDQWTWALRQFVVMSGVEFRTVVIDEGPSVIYAVKEAFPRSKIRHCLFHVENNFKTHLKVFKLKSDTASYALRADSTDYQIFKTLWHSVIFANTFRAISERLDALIAWVRLQDLTDLAHYLNGPVRAKLPEVCNIYFEGRVSPLSSSIVESNHYQLKSILKNHLGHAKYNARAVDIVTTIYAAVKRQPSVQYSATMRSNGRWGKKSMTREAVDTPISRLKEVIDKCFGNTVQKQVLGSDLMLETLNFGMRILEGHSLKEVILLLEKSYDNPEAYRILPIVEAVSKRNHVLDVRTSMYMALKRATPENAIVYLLNKYTNQDLVELHDADNFGNTWDACASPDGVDGDLVIIVISKVDWLYECSCSNYHTGLACVHYWKVMTCSTGSEPVYFNPLVYHFSHWKDVKVENIPRVLLSCFKRTITLTSDVYQESIESAWASFGALPIDSSASLEVNSTASKREQEDLVKEIEAAAFVKNLLKEAVAKEVEQQSGLEVIDGLDNLSDATVTILAQLYNEKRNEATIQIPDIQALPPKLLAKVIDLDLKKPNSRALQDENKSKTSSKKSSLRTYEAAHQEFKPSKGRPRKGSKTTRRDRVDTGTPPTTPSSVHSPVNNVDATTTSQQLCLNMDDDSVSDMSETPTSTPLVNEKGSISQSPVKKYRSDDNIYKKAYITPSGRTRIRVSRSPAKPTRAFSLSPSIAEHPNEGLEEREEHAGDTSSPGIISSIDNSPALPKRKRISTFFAGKIALEFPSAAAMKAYIATFVIIA